MRRLLAVAAIAVAAFATPAPASAGPGGDCSGAVDTLCVSGSACDQGWCYQTLCVVWYHGRCYV